jgi:hypothetical protein
VVAIVLLRAAILSSFSTLTTCPNFGVHYIVTDFGVIEDKEVYSKVEMDIDANQ